jgi:arginase family enzyme
VDAEEVRAAFERASARAAAGERPRDGADTGADAPAFAGTRPAARPDDLWGAAAVVLGIPHSAAEAAAAEGPAAIRRHSAVIVPAGAALQARDYGDVAVDAGDVQTTFLRAHDKLADVLAAGAVPVVLGGDRSVSIPALQVLAAKLTGRLGIVAFDGRLDLRYGPRYGGRSRWARALELGVADPANLVIVGVREDAVTERARCVAEELGLRWFTTADVDELGIAAVAQDALEAAAAGTEAVYLSLDVTVAGSASGASTTASPGLGARELLHALRTLATGRLAGLDVCCLAPARDLSGALGRIAAASVLTVLEGVAAQGPG